MLSYDLLDYFSKAGRELRRAPPARMLAPSLGKLGAQRVVRPEPDQTIVNLIHRVWIEQQGGVSQLIGHSIDPRGGYRTTNDERFERRNVGRPEERRHYQRTRPAIKRRHVRIRDVSHELNTLTEPFCCHECPHLIISVSVRCSDQNEANIGMCVLHQRDRLDQRAMILMTVELRRIEEEFFRKPITLVERRVLGRRRLAHVAGSNVGENERARLWNRVGLDELALAHLRVDQNPLCPRAGLAEMELATLVFAVAGYLREGALVPVHQVVDGSECGRGRAKSIAIMIWANP